MKTQADPKAIAARVVNAGSFKFRMTRALMSIARHWEKLRGEVQRNGKIQFRTLGEKTGFKFGPGRLQDKAYADLTSGRREFHELESEIAIAFDQRWIGGRKFRRANAMRALKLAVRSARG